MVTTEKLVRERTPVEPPPSGVGYGRVNRLLLFAVAVLAAGLASLGGWVLVDHYTGSPSAAEQIVDRFATVWSSGSGAGASTIYAPTAVEKAFDGSTITGSAALGALIQQAGTIDLKVERLTPVSVSGEFVSTFVRLGSTTGSNTILLVLQVRDGKIVRQWNFTPGLTQPFDNIQP